MPTRQLKAKQVIEPQQSKLSERPLAIIARQSSTRQVKENIESLKLQIEDARQRFINQGWSEDIITIRIAGDGKKGVSGTLRIDQRAELIDTISDIKAGICKAVGAYSISRLFRDKYGVEVATFVKICAEHDVLIILPDKTYDFRNDDDVTLFVILARFAARENEERKRLLRDAKLKTALRGEYDGRFIPPGFIVDRDEDSPTLNKYIEYPPHAKVSRWLYRRFRELGAFNLLAAEVAKLPFVFPEFEEWVSKLDKSRFQFKRVPGGYHISRTSLMHLLTAVEYAGYWHVKGVILTDEHGAPLVNHAAIVPYDDWEYAFKRLSFHTLDGLPNKERTHGHTWIPSGKQSRGGALQGILTSPLGTVNSSCGVYRVSEHREGHSQTSDTLVIDSDVIDEMFPRRLFERLAEINGHELFHERVQKLLQQHAEELLTVPQQIAGYEKERAGIQAYIKAVGATADEATLQKYNQDLLEITAHISELQAKQKRANAFASKVAQLRERVSSAQETLLGTQGSNESSLDFLRLLCDAIILDEYSSRFATLTIRWAAPFERTDICYIYRPVGARQEWSSADEDFLRLHYRDGDRLDILQHFPKRSWASIAERARKLGLMREHDRNTAGITNRALSYNDWQLIEQHGWTGPAEGYAEYWLFDIVDNRFETSVRQS